MALNKDNMDPRFAPHNTHKESKADFASRDPHLSLLKRQKLVYRYPVLAHLPNKPGIYSITGGRQIGKSTVVKQWMADLLASGVPADRITYLAGELIDDHHSLLRVFTDLFPDAGAAALSYLILDEVTFVRDWVRGVKYLADAGLLRHVVLLLTGSDSVLIQEARAQLPGRRGQAPTVDFHLFPLSFAEFLNLKNLNISDQLPAVSGERWPRSFYRSFPIVLIVISCMADT